MYATAHSEDSSSESGEKYILSYSDPVIYIEITAAILIILGLYILTIGKRFAQSHKKTLFWSLAVPIILSSVYLGGHTVYENIVSESGGPVHWHADYQVWVCGQRLDLANPEFPSNKVGTPLFHEHNDDRIHVEGTLNRINDVSLGRYFEVIGGELYDGHLRYKAVTGDYDYSDGDSCPDGKQSNLKVYLNGERLEDYTGYVIYPNSYVPPGDCIIIVFDDSDSENTDMICESWKAKGWSYGSYTRPDAEIGGYTW